jgi:putative DNA methylase
VETLTGLNQQAKGLYRDENLFEDADLQMAGYAAALRVADPQYASSTADMAVPRPAGRACAGRQKTFVDELIDFAVGVANQFLAPRASSKSDWEAERRPNVSISS